MFSKLINRFSGAQMIAIGFFFIILIGSLLLCLPFATRPGSTTDFQTAVFTATSATCVTGLILVDTFSHWTLFGQLVILTLIQIGGLGFITIGITVSMVLGKKIGLKQRGLIRESLNVLELQGAVRLIRRVVRGTILFESVGAFILACCFIPKMGFLQGVYYGVFHSISAFCNAGFDLMGRYEPFSSFTSYYDDPVVTITLMALILIGGLGFVVWNDLYNKKWNFPKYMLHTKIILTAGAVLVFGGAILFYIMEHDQLFSDMTTSGKILASLFCSITPRTAGFNTVDVGALSDGSKLLTVVLMFIGGGSGSTAGGVKVTTIVVLLLFLKANLMRSTGVNIFGRRLDNEAVSKASAVFCTNLFLGMIATIFLCSYQNFDVIDTLVEVFSANGTVGMSAGLTGQLNFVSRNVIILLMYLGRIGSLTFAMSFTDKKKIAHVLLPVEKINIG